MKFFLFFSVIKALQLPLRRWCAVKRIFGPRILALKDRCLLISPYTSKECISCQWNYVGTVLMIIIIIIIIIITETLTSEDLKSGDFTNEASPFIPNLAPSPEMVTPTHYNYFMNLLVHPSSFFSLQKKTKPL